MKLNKQLSQFLHNGEQKENKFAAAIECDIVEMVVLSGSNSVVECQLPKLDVAGSNPVSRSNKTKYLGQNQPSTIPSISLDAFGTFAQKPL